MQPLVSIIIPTYNRAHLIGETLDSVIAQTFKNWESIVVDDGSSDYTKEIMEFYCELDPRIFYIKRPVELPKGANSCRNYGFKRSRGEYIQWFDSDDVMLPSFLELKIKTLKKKRELELTICSGFIVDEYLNIKKTMKIMGETELFHSLVTWENEIITDSVLFRKSFLENKELFSHHIVRGEEAEFFSRLFFQLPPEKYSITEEPLFLYRQHSGTKTEIDKNYSRAFMQSRIRIFTENLQRSIQLEDKGLIKFHYIKLIEMFSNSLKNRDLKNSISILRNFVPKIWHYDKKLAIEVGIFFGIFIIVRRGSYRIENYLKKK